MVSPIGALNSALAGIQRESGRVEKDARDIQKAFTAAQNAQAADSVSVSDRASVAPAVEDAVRGAVLGQGGDVSAALVDMIAARAAYKANVSSAKVTGDVESDLTRLLGKTV